VTVGEHHVNVVSASEPAIRMMIVRVWGDDATFRAILSWSDDVEMMPPFEGVGASSPEEVLSLVEVWIRQR
jgi:hypothetical protein